MQPQPAPLTKRFLALFIDWLVIVAYAMCLLGVTLLIYAVVFNGIPDVLGTVGRGGAQLLGFVTLTLPMVLYFFFTESGKHYASWGKRFAKIKVAGTDGSTLTKQHILIRTLIKLLPWEFAHTFVYQVVHYSQDGGTPPWWVMTGLVIANVLPILYIGMILARKDRRGPHDLAASTVVTPESP